MDFHEIWYISICRKSAKKTQVLWKSDKKNRYFTGRPIKNFWFFFTQLYLEWEMLQTKGVEEIKTHISCSIFLRSLSLSLSLSLYIYIYTGCNRRNGPNFWRVFLMLNYTEKTQNTCIQSWTVWEIIAIENWKLWTSFESTNDSLESYLISSREHRTTEARVKCISLHFLWRSYSTSCGVSVFGRQQTLHISSDVTR